MTFFGSCLDMKVVTERGVTVEPSTVQVGGSVCRKSRSRNYPVESLSQ